MTTTEKAIYAFRIANLMNVENCKEFGEMQEIDPNESLPDYPKSGGLRASYMDNCNEIISLAEAMVAHG